MIRRTGADKKRECPCCHQIERLTGEQVQIHNGDDARGGPVCESCDNDTCNMFEGECGRPEPIDNDYARPFLENI